MTFVYRERRFYTASATNDQSYFPAMRNDGDVTGINSAPKYQISRGAKREYGALGGIRTHDLSLRRAALYPAELQAHKVWTNPRTEFYFNKHKYGAEGESRTRTPLRALRPERSASAISPPRHEVSDTKSEWWAM